MLHLGGGSGASEIAQTAAERAAILKFSRGVRTQVSAVIDGNARPTEIEVVGEDEAPPPSDPSKGAPSEDAEATEPDVAPTPPPTAQPTAQPESVQAPEPPKPTPTEKPPAEKPPAEKPPLPEAPPTPALPAPPPAPALPNGRIAIENDPTLDKNQKDNPDASRIADQANTVEEETQAANRSYDQNAPKPNGGGAPHEGPDKKPGNADEDDRGHSIETKGDGPPKAGSEHGPEHEAAPAARTPLAPENQSGRAATPGEKPLAPSTGGKGERMPEAVSSEGGTYSLDPDGGDGRERAESRAGRRGKRGLKALEGMILPGQLPSNYRIDAYGLRDVLGAPQLRAEAEAARNTRLNKHRGTLRGMDFQKYRAAIENYVPQVKEGNQTSLNAARVPFASYINRMHNQIHPIFAEGFLASLEKNGDPRLADVSLVTHVEIVLDGATGSLVKAGIVKPSGVTAFEVAALRSLEEAAPYGKAPEIIVSPDGNVYLHWEFYRDPFYACTSQFAHPYMLKNPAPSEPAPTPALPPRAPGGEPPKYGAR